MSLLRQLIDGSLVSRQRLMQAREFFGADADKRIAAIKEKGYTLVGDVHPSEADAIAGRRTPVPGGVGLLTVAMLMKNTLQAAKWRRGV